MAAELVDMPSVSGTEAPLATAIDDALSALPHLRVDRDGDAVVARTDARPRPAGLPRPGTSTRCRRPDNLPAPARRRAAVRARLLRHEGRRRGGPAAGRDARVVADPTRDVTYVFYDGEEVEEPRNGLRRLAEQHPRLAGLRPRRADGAHRRRHRGRLPGHAARRGRAPRAGARTAPGRGWGSNAIHAAGPVLRPARGLRAAARRPVDGLEYHEGLNAVGISGGVAGNVIPDECVVTVNYRFAPDRSLDEARGARARGLRRASTSSSPTPQRGAARAGPCRRRGRSSRRSAGARDPSSAGPTWPASPRWASRRSTTGPATRSSRTPGRSTSPRPQIVECEERLLRLADPGAEPEPVAPGSSRACELVARVAQVSRGLSVRPARLDGRDVQRDLDLVADEDAAALERRRSRSGRSPCG